jgi:hypothetical protein
VRENRQIAITGDRKCATIADRLRSKHAPSCWFDSGGLHNPSVNGR